MKVFQVITEHCKGDSTEITETVTYVTSENNTLLSVVEEFSAHCYQYEKYLKSVREVLNITHHIALQEDE